MQLALAGKSHGLCCRGLEFGREVKTGVFKIGTAMLCEQEPGLGLGAIPDVSSRTIWLS